MRSFEQFASVIELDAAGLNHSQIAARTGVPRRTVVGWLAGRGPRAHRWALEGLRSCAVCGHPEHDPETLDGARYSCLLGLYLGDGHIASFPRALCLRIVLDARYRRIIEECARAMSAVVPRNAVSVIPHRVDNSTRVQAYSRQWKCLLPQHGPGRKHERAIVLSEWQLQITRRFPQQLVRGLIHSDGSRFANPVRHGARLYVYPRYEFSNRSRDIHRIFTDHLDLLGIPWRSAGRYHVSVARREGVARLDEFVGPKR